MPETPETTGSTEHLPRAAILEQKATDAAEAIKRYTVMVGNRAIEVATATDANAKKEILHQAAAGVIAREIITGKDPKGRNFDMQKFEDLDEEGKAAVSVELIRAVGLVQFKESFQNYFRRSAKDLVNNLIAAGLSDVVARYLPDFAQNQVEKENIALLLMREGQGFRVAMHRKLFGDMDPGIEKLVNDYM